MAYGNLYDGLRVFTAVTGTDADAADVNELQDQLKVIMQPRKWSISLPMFHNSDDWAFDSTQARWEEETHTSGGVLLAPVYLPDTCKIVEAAVWLIGSASQTGGTIKLVRQQNGVAGVSTVASLDETNPWAVTSITEVTTGEISHLVDSSYSYWIEIINATGGPIADNYVYGAMVYAGLYGA